MAQTKIHFQITLTAGEDGKLRAVYVYLRKTMVAKTKEIVQGTVLADYDSRRNLVGIEILGPAKIRVLAELVDEEHRAEFRRFARNIPAKFLRKAA